MEQREREWSSDWESVERSMCDRESWFSRDGGGGGGGGAVVVATIAILGDERELSSVWRRMCNLPAKIGFQL